MSIQQLMKQAQTLKAKMDDIQKGLESSEIVGTSGGGLVKAYTNGKGVVRRFEIDPSLMQESEKGMLEDLLVAAINSAKNEADSLLSSSMKNAGLPPEMMNYG